jgi:hypothetical protein
MLEEKEKKTSEEKADAAKTEKDIKKNDEDEDATYWWEYKMKEDQRRLGLYEFHGLGKRDPLSYRLFYMVCLLFLYGTRNRYRLRPDAI